MNDNQGVSLHIKNNATETTNELNKVLEVLTQITNQIDKVITNTEKSTNATKKTTDQLDKTLKNLNFDAITNNIAKFTRTIDKYASGFVDYIEDLNLLKVAFGDTADEAKNMIENIADITGFDDATLVRMTATFRQLSSTLGLANEDADLLSKNLMKMSLDVSSLYNLDLNTAKYALQGALTAQPRSIKTHTGADVTQATLQAELARLGIDRKISSLNQAEKAIITYLSLERQLINSNGDLARTIEQPANMLKIFREQLTRAGRSIGNLFIPVIQATLPYLTAFLDVFSTIVDVITSFLGIDTDAFWESMETGANNAQINFDNLNESIKKVNSGLRSFDKLNAIKTPSSSGSGSSLGMGIDSNLLKYLDEYDLKLDGVKTKAKEIMENTMNTLGFHKELNEETGQWEWIYGGIVETVKGLYNWFKKTSPQVKTVSTLLGIIAGATIYNGLRKLVGIIGATGLWKWASKALVPTQVLVEQIGLLSSSNYSLKGTIDHWSSLLGPMEKVQTALVGTAGIVAGLAITKESFKDVAEEGINATNLIAGSVGGLMTTISAGLIGSSFGGFTGGIIGLAIGGITSIVTAMDTIDTALNTNMGEIEKLGENVSTLYNDWQESIKNLQKSYENANVETDYYQRLWEELKGITDENGNIKKGYEDRAEVITTILSEALGVEIDVVNGNIKKWQELQGEIDNYIIKRKNAIKLEALEKEASEALEKMAEAQKSVTDNYNKLTKAEKNLMPNLEKYANLIGISTESLHKYLVEGKTTAEILDLMDGKHGNQVSTLERAKSALEKQVKAVQIANTNYETASETLDGYRQTIKNYETALGYSLQNNEEALDKFFDHEQYLYGKSYDDQYKYWEDRIQLNKLSLERLEVNRDNYTKEDYEALKKSYEDEILLSKTEMDKLKLVMDTKTGEISDSMIDKWIEMGTKSETEFITKISELPSDIQKEVVDKMKEKGFKITEEIQKGLDENIPTVDVEINATESKGFETRLSTIFNKVKNSLSKALGGLDAFGGGDGFGGFRADGGFVDTGQLFVAREAGAELVGTIGNKTAVANNQQIVDAVAQGVKNAIISSGGFGKNKVIIEAHGDADGMMNFITFKQKEQDMQYGN